MRLYTLLALIISLISFDALAIDSMRYKALMESIDDAAFSDDKLEVLRGVKGESFTGEQARRLLEAFSMSDDKLEALRLIAPEYQTAMGEIGKAFAFDDDRSEARRILQSAGAASGGASAVSGPNKNRCANFTLWQTGGQSDGTMAKARFNEMGTTVKGESFSDSKVEALRSFLDVAPEGLKPSQVQTIIGWFSFRDDKLKALRSIEDRIVGLTSKEMKGLISAYAFSDDKIKVLKIVKDTLLDLENRYDVVEAFTFDKDKKKARKILGSIEGRTYLWGTVRAQRPVFVLDTSGSMREAGTQPDGSQGSRLAFLKKEMTEVLQAHIAPSDQFEIIMFNGSVTPLNQKLVRGTDKNRARASQMIDASRPRGGTNIHDALETAFPSPCRRGLSAYRWDAPAGVTIWRIRNAFSHGMLSRYPASFCRTLTGSGPGGQEAQAAKFMFELAQQNCGQFRLVRWPSLRKRASMKIKNRVVVVTGHIGHRSGALPKTRSTRTKGTRDLGCRWRESICAGGEIGRFGLAVDVSKEDEVKSSIDEVGATFGPIDIM